MTIAIVIVVGAGVHFAKAKNVRGRAVSVLLTNDNPSETYQNKTYGFTFQYPTDLVPISTLNDTAVTLAGKNGEHWAYGISAKNNSEHRTLDSLFNEMLDDRLTWITNTDNKKVVSDILLGGKPAKRYSITNNGDYGNAGVMVLSDNTIVSITGDDSTDGDKKDFDALLSTFTFQEITPSVIVKIQQCPDAWIDNQMPSVGEEKPVTEYYILKGERLEINAFDAQWIQKNCTLIKQVVY